MAISNVYLSYTKSKRTAGGLDNAAYPPIANASAPDNLTSQDFVAATWAAVTIPTGATGVVVIPPANNTGNITEKGANGDTGKLLGAITQPYWTPVVAGTSVLGFLCANNTTLEFDWT